MFQVYMFLFRWALPVLVWIKADKEAASSGLLVAAGEMCDVAAVATAAVALLVDLHSVGEMESCWSCQRDNLLAMLGGDLPSLVGRRSAGGNEMLELCWEATT
jgi:hypothetical protein